jgi:hypothetical protein
MRNIRQALASPYPVHSHDSAGLTQSRCTMGAAAPDLAQGGRVMNRLRLVAATILLASSVACAGAFRSPRIADIQYNPGRYHDRVVNISGVVTTSWGLPLVPFKFYKVDDGTGEVTVLSNGNRLPGRGARVQVRGRVEEVAMFGGQTIGLHVKEQRLSIRN